MAAVLLASPAQAAGPKPPAPVCAPLDKLKAGGGGKAHFVALTAGQFHFMQGVYVAAPNTPPGLPPGDGALLVTHDGDKDGVILWTRGKNGCSPIPVPDELIKILNTIKTGVDETLPDL
jgi:hypothetical protein